MIQGKDVCFMNFSIVFVLGLFRIAQSVLNKSASRYTDTTAKTLRFGIIFESLAALFSLLYLFHSGFDGIHLATLLCALLTGLGFLCELLTSLAMLRRAPLVLCTLCSLGGSIVPPAVIGISFFNEPLSVSQWIGVVLFFLSAVLLTPKHKENHTFSLRKILPFALANFLINGAIVVIGKYYAVCVSRTNPALFSCWSYVFAAILFGIVLMTRPKEAFSPAFPKKMYLIACGLGVVCATIVFSGVILAKIVPLVILNTVPNAICITGSLFIGGLFFKEKITPLHLVGALISIISITAILL